MKKKASKSGTGKGFPAVHDRTVEALARGLRPVAPASGTFSQWMLWGAAALALACLMLTRLSLRPDMGVELSSLGFLLPVLLLAAGSALAAWGALESGLPAEEKKGKWKAKLALAAWALAALAFLFLTPCRRAAGDLAPAGLFPCVEVVLLCGALSWLGLGFLIVRNAPLHPRRSALWAGLSSFLFGGAVITLHCGSTDPVHVILAHFLPVLLFSLPASWLGAAWFSRWKRKPIVPSGRSVEK